jgi:hypothetical protein
MGIPIPMTSEAGLREVGRLAGAMSARIGLALAGKDDSERKEFAFRLVRALPHPARRLISLLDDSVFDPLTREQLEQALLTEHSPDEVGAFVQAVLRAGLPDSAAWDVAWDLYAVSASKHAPMLTIRSIPNRSREVLDALGGCFYILTGFKGYAGDDDDDDDE